MSVDNTELVRDVCGDDVDVATEVLQSARKEVGELEKIVDEIDYLNKTKRQMIWLLRQVITGETML